MFSEWTHLTLYKERENVEIRLDRECSFDFKWHKRKKDKETAGAVPQKKQQKQSVDLEKK